MKKQILILGIIVIVTLGFFFLTTTSNSNSGTLFETEAEVLEPHGMGNETEAQNVEIEESAPHGKVFVDVQGEVMNPGVFEVDSHVRIGYLIDLAGGLTDDANVRGLNQAARIYDEMVIFVPHIEGANEAIIEIHSSKENVTHADDSELISLSTANASELQSLPGIGPTISANIIAYREENGGFSTIDELVNVSGIGARTMENIREFIKP